MLRTLGPELTISVLPERGVVLFYIEVDGRPVPVTDDDGRGDRGGRGGRGTGADAPWRTRMSVLARSGTGR